MSGLEIIGALAIAGYLVGGLGTAIYIFCIIAALSGGREKIPWYGKVWITFWCLLMWPAFLVAAARQ